MIWRSAVACKAVLLILVSIAAGINAKADDVAYATLSNGGFVSLDLTTGTSTGIGYTDFLAGIGWSGGVLYGADSTFNGAADNNLVSINPSTAAATPVGDIGVPLATFAGLTSGALYGLDANNNVYSINPITGNATLIGPTGLPADEANFANALAGDATHLYYVLENPPSDPDPVQSSLYSLNLATGQATLIGLTGTSGIVGMAYVNGTLYGLTSFYNVDIIDTTDGAASFQRTYGEPGDPTVFGGVPTTSPTPEPAAVPLVLTGLAGLSLLRRPSWFAMKRRSR